MKYFLLFLLSLITCSIFGQDAVVYYTRPGGKQVITVDGDTSYVDSKKKIKVDKIFVFSINNENTEFYIEAIVKKLGTEVWPVLMVNDKYYRCTGRSSGGTINSITFRVNNDQALEIAEAFKTTCNLRKHFGHQLKAEFVPLKDDYKAGDSVYVNFKLSNIGTVPVMYNKGGMYRNANGRCDYFNFDVYYDGILLPDEGPEWNFGGIESRPELKPNETDSVIECITKWSHFRKPGKYTIKCSYRLHLETEKNEKNYPENQNDMHKVWDEKIEKTIEITIVE